MEDHGNGPDEGTDDDERLTLSGRPLPTDDELKAAGWVRASRRVRLIGSTPRVGQWFWIDFPHDAYEPEFVGEHPGVVVRAARTMHDTCVVVPLTSRPQEDAKHKHRLAKNPNPRVKEAEREVWAVCDHLYTVHIARLRPAKDRYGGPVYPKVTPEDLQGIFAAVRSALHRVFEPPPPAQPPSSDDAPSRPAPSRPPGPNTLTLPPKKT